MANPPTDYYVDPDIAADSGAGTIGDPWGDIQYALNQVTQDTTDGDRFNIKAGTAEILSASLSLTSYGAPGFAFPLIFQGYTSVQGDRGQGSINCNAFTVIVNAGNCINWYDMEMYAGLSTGSVVDLIAYSTISGCYIHDSDGHGIRMTLPLTMVEGCRLEDLGGSSYDMINAEQSQTRINNNYFLHGGSRTCRNAVLVNNVDLRVINNIISVAGASNGINTATWHGTDVCSNTILSAGGTGKGIASFGSNAPLLKGLYNNYVEGFSGTGGVGISAPDTSNGCGVYGKNATYNNATDYDFQAETHLRLGDNEVLASSGIAKSGADTWANRFTYFTPLDVGNMRTGGYPEA